MQAKNEMQAIKSLNEKIAGIVESGSNTNGNWIKFSNGIIQQWGSINNTSAGSVNLYFPVEFIDNNYSIQVTNRYYSNGGTEATKIIQTVQYGLNGQICTIYFRDANGVSQTNQNMICNWFAIGRWK